MDRGLVGLTIILLGFTFPVLVYVMLVMVNAESKGDVDDLPGGYETD